VRHDATHTAMKMELHPVVFLANLGEIERAGFSIGESAKELPETELQYVKASDFTLMNCTGRRIKASDLGSADTYVHHKSKFFTKTKEGTVAVQELATFEKLPIELVVRFPTNDEKSVPYKIVVRDRDALGVLLIHPGSR